MAAGDVNTFPHCGACGYNVSEYNVNSDEFCDSCGADVTDFGFGKAATGTAGIPGVWDGYAPTDIADMSGVVASPGTAWTTGQYIWSGDRSQTYWDSAAWVAGVAP